MVFRKDNDETNEEDNVYISFFFLLSIYSNIILNYILFKVEYYNKQKQKIEAHFVMIYDLSIPSPRHGLKRI